MASEQDKPDTGNGTASAVSEGQAQIASKNTATNQLMVKQTETQTNQNQMDKTIDGKKLVGVTLLTGFLGSGKTTFLNYILKEKHGKRIAVIENEFGDEKGIEKLIAKNTQDGDAVVDLDGLFVELSNGCICCAVKDDLVTTLEGLLERSDKFDYIFIETTGVADPGPLVGAFWLDQELESRIYLDAVVTVVDLKNLQKNLDDPRKQNDEYVNEAQKQIAYADIVIMNKRDLVDEQEFQKVQGRVQTINPFAKYLVSSYSVVKVDEILDFRGYDAIEDYSPSKMQKELLALEAKASQKDVSEDSKEHDHESNDNHGHGHKHSHDKGEGECEQCSALSTSKHDPTVHSVVVRTPVPLVKRKLERWIGSLLWNTEDDEEATEYVQNKPEFFRIKGVVNIADSNHVCVIQGVHETFELEESPEQWGQGEFENRFTRVVFIGRYLDVEKLRQQMEACN